MKRGWLGRPVSFLAGGPARSWSLTGASLLFLVAVALVHRAVGEDVSFLAFYALPVLLATLSRGLATGIGLAAFASGAWLLVRWPSPDPAAVLAWNLLNRAFLFAVVALLGALYRRESSSARRDPLTGLPNRRAIFEGLHDAAEAAGSRSGSDALVMLDLDGFKEINDRKGHHAGDEALRVVAHALRKGIRPGDLAGRLAGDEFVLLLRRVSPDQARSLAGRVLEEIRREGAASGSPDLSASAGVAVADLGVTPPNQVLAEADAALREAKGTVRGQVVLRRVAKALP